MKTWGAVLRYSLLGLVAMVLGTAAFSSGSEVGVVPEVAVAAEKSSLGAAATSRFVFPEEMPVEQKERWARVLELRAREALASDSIMDHPHYWWDQMPYGCDRPFVMDVGYQYSINFDDGHPRGAWSQEAPYVGSHWKFWSCFVAAYNEFREMGDPIPHGVYQDSISGNWFAESGSFLHPYDSNFSVQWATMRADTILDYCGGNAWDCARPGVTYYAYDGGFTCAESLIVVMFDERGPGPLVFGYEIFDDVPWDEYFACY